MEREAAIKKIEELMATVHEAMFGLAEIIDPNQAREIEEGLRPNHNTGIGALYEGLYGSWNSMDHQGIQSELEAIKADPSWTTPEVIVEEDEE